MEVYLFREWALIQGGGVYLGKCDILFYLCNLLLYQNSSKHITEIYWFFLPKITGVFTEKLCNFTEFYPTEIYCYWNIFLLIYRPLPLLNFLDNHLPTHPLWTILMYDWSHFTYSLQLVQFAWGNLADQMAVVECSMHVYLVVS